MTALRARIISPNSADSWTWHSDAVLTIDERGRIATLEPYAGQPVDEDLRPAILMPGFVDAHLHFPQTRIIGSASGALLEWLNATTFPEEARFHDAAYARDVAALFCTRLAAAGTTLSMVYGSVHPQATDQLLSEMSQRGMRCIAGPVLMDEHCPEALQLPTPLAIDALSKLVDTWHGHDDRLHVGVIPRFALCCSRTLLTQAGEFAQRHDLSVSTHLSENTDECEIARQRFNARDYLSIYEDCGLLHERSVMAHCIHLSSSEWERFAAAGATVAHCPDSNAFLGSGGMPLEPIASHGIAVAMGTDVGAGRSFRIPHMLSRAYDNAVNQNQSLSLSQLLWWGTRGGALALGHSEVGALTVGLEADLACIDVPDWIESPEQVLSWIFYYADAPSVQRTWVRGKPVWRRPDPARP